MGTHLILVGLLSICSLSFGQDCNQQLLENMDIQGNDITSLFSPDAEHCQLLCTQHPSCDFFTFVRPDSTNDVRHFFCIIKTAPNGQPSVQVPLEGVTSGFSLKPCSQTKSLACLSVPNVDSQVPTTEPCYRETMRSVRGLAHRTLPVSSLLY
ncbi:plasma kallikrein [Etheostoma spectabile]|uniref:plasma kallikrein n=1 Tax=Etheostoma spectabile TaxID=54343 RepID=UPI0013AFBC53|nr:plasma kallikrein-like [Etheostoma spectabile]